MAAKKKTKKKKGTTSRKRVMPKKKAPKRTVPKKKAATKKKKTARKKTATRTRTRPKVAAKKKARKAVTPSVRRPASETREVDTVEYTVARRSARSSGLSGDLQGLSGVESANSESVDELLEEGNAFEADVLTGVQDADNADEREVRTHEVPEDDVPEEYLDKD